MSSDTLSAFRAGDGGGLASGYADYQGELLLLDGPRGLVEALEQGRDVRLGTGGVRSCREMRALLKAWLPPLGLLEWYHVFESYRQGGLDSVLTEAIFHALSGQVDQNGDPLQVCIPAIYHASLIGEPFVSCAVVASTRLLSSRGKRLGFVQVLLDTPATRTPNPRERQVFLDKRRLQKGQNFREDFAHALVASHVAVPVPETRNPRHETCNANPEKRKTRHKIRNPKPETRNPQPGT